MEEKFNKTIRKGIVIFMVILVSVIIGLLILKYDVEGETDMPFEISKIVLISTAEGIQKAEPTAKWDMQIDQNNDIYIYIEKNNKYKTRDAIQTITIDNFQTTRTNTNWRKQNI